MKYGRLLGVVTCTLTCAMACGNEGTPGVGDPCIPALEDQPAFSGFSVTEVTVEAGHQQCETGLCLVNHFGGRVSCPYGQTVEEATEAATSADWGTRCRVPGTTGDRARDRVMVPVAPQRVGRRASDTVYCSCRCASPDGRHADGNLCTCPQGYECRPLIGELGLGNEDLAGSYCVKAGTEYDDAEAEVSMPCTYQPSFPGGADESPAYCGDPVP